MATLGMFISAEEHPGSSLLAQAKLAEQSGFDRVMVSDHYHPWNSAQGNSPFVWSVLGAIAAATDLHITTGVTCPTVRIHPAVIAQAAATMGELTGGKFRLGVGSGEALNEHIFGDVWPVTDVRLEMLEEAIELMRAMWKGETVTHHGRHYTVEDARIWTLPADPVDIAVSAFGPKALELASRVGDGFVTVQPDGESVRSYKDQGGAGPTIGALKMCWGPDEDEALTLAHRLWANEGLPGELAQVLPTPAHFEQASTLVTKEMVGESVPHGPDPEPAVKAVTEYIEAGFDEIFVNQIGPDQEGWAKWFTTEVRPRLGL